MKYLIVLAAATALAGCSKPAEQEPAAQAPEAAATQPAQVMAADGQPAPGTYRVTTEGGDVFTEELKPDGRYIQTDADGTVVETGRWVQKSPQDYCWTVDEQYREEGDTGAEKCNTEAVGADGVWTSTNADGETATVERM